MQQQQPQPIPPNTPLTVTLEAQEWNVVFGALNEVPMRVSRGVFDKIMSQIQQETNPELPPSLRPNGEAGQAHYRSEP